MPAQNRLSFHLNVLIVGPGCPASARPVNLLDLKRIRFASSKDDALEFKPAEQSAKVGEVATA